MINRDSGDIYTKDKAVEREKGKKEEKVNNVDRGVLFLKKLSPQSRLL